MKGFIFLLESENFFISKVELRELDLNFIELLLRTTPTLLRGFTALDMVEVEGLWRLSFLSSAGNSCMSVSPELVLGDGKPIFTSGTSILNPSILVAGFSKGLGKGIFSLFLKASKALFEISLVGEQYFSVMPFQILL
jgi:hypothetical protein